MKVLRRKFKNSEGVELSALLQIPADGEAHNWVLFAHCFTCGMHIHGARHMSRALTQNGYGVMRFDFTGIGQSEGDFADTNLSTNISDLIAAANYLRDKHQAPRMLIGHSLGGAAVLRAAPLIPEVEAVATIGAPADPDHVLHLVEAKIEAIQQLGEADVSIAGRNFQIKKHFIEDLRNHSLDQCLRDLDAALLVMHSPTDTVVGIDNARHIYNRAMHPKSFISLDGADHLLSMEEDSLYAGDMIASWARRYLPRPESRPLESDRRVVVEIGPDDHYTTEVRAGRHSLLADEPKKVGGADLGPTPYDLLVSGLGACTAMTLRMYADRKGWPLEEVRVHLEHSKLHYNDCADCESTGKIDTIVREIELEGDLSEEQRNRLLEIANRCPVHKTLNSPVKIPTSLRD